MVTSLKILLAQFQVGRGHLYSLIRCSAIYYSEQFILTHFAIQRAVGIVYNIYCFMRKL